MVKTMWFLKRRSDMSPADFHRYWRDKHGPLFCNSSAARQYVVRYEQNHATPENAALSDDDFDGASVMWLRSIEDFQAMFADPEFQNVMADGENFLDLTATKQLVCFAEESFDIPDKISLTGR